MADNCWCGGRTTTHPNGTDLACEASLYHDPLATGRPSKVRLLYVSGPMTGYPECNYPAFNAAAKRLTDAGYVVTNPADFGDEGSHYVDLLREDLKVLLECAGVASLPEWWESTGARTEIMVAGVLKMPVRTVDDWIALVTPLVHVSACGDINCEECDNQA